MLEFLWNTAAFIIAIGLLISIHEFGHFYVARRCGVKVERFAIGFGKPLWRRVGADGTEYVIAMIPLGGYVKMLDGRVADVPVELQDQAFDRKPVGQRMAIVAAGPLANFGLAIALWFVQFLLGVSSVKPVLSESTQGSIAATAQLPNQGIITAVGSKSVSDWDSLNVALASEIGAKQIVLAVEHQNQNRTYTLDTQNWHISPDKEALTTSLGINLWMPEILPVLGYVDEQGAAYAAGMRQGDRIIAIDGIDDPSWAQIVTQISRHADLALPLMVERDGATLALTVIPKGIIEQGQLSGRIGVAPTREAWPEAYKVTQQFGVFGSFTKAVEQTWDFSVLTLSTFGKLFTGDLGLDNLGGPIAIAQGAGNSAGVGLVYFIGFLAVLSVNLGIINLFPLPVLDGGHLLYYFIELCTGKPVPEKVQEVGFRIGSALLLLLMTFAIFNDVARL